MVIVVVVLFPIFLKVFRNFFFCISQLLGNSKNDVPKVSEIYRYGTVSNVN